MADNAARVLAGQGTPGPWHVGLSCTVCGDLLVAVFGTSDALDAALRGNDADS